MEKPQTEIRQRSDLITETPQSSSGLSSFIEACSFCNLSLGCQPGTTSAQGCAPALRGMLTICPFALDPARVPAMRLGHRT
ncbi:hypothetical protein BDW67DRAFT_167562 [Aspergillus spinulosporus]